MMDKHLLSLARKVKLAVFDVDGVMTSGAVMYDSSGQEIKAFSILDGLGIKLLRQSGVDVAIITGRSSKMVERRAKELGLDILIQGREDKLMALNELLETHGVSLSEVAYLGDDLPDLPAIRAVGLGMTVANGYSLVKEYADGVTVASGGQGAVREFCDLIMHAQGTLSSMLSDYL